MARLFDDAQQEYLKRTTSVPLSSYPFVMACWYFTDALNTDQTLVSLGEGAAAWYYALQLREDVDDLCAIGYGAGQALRQADSSINYSINIWQHACGLWVNSTDMRILLNGANKGTTANVQGAVTPDAVSIGISADSTPFGYMSGRIAEAAIWDISNWPGATASDKANEFERVAVPGLALGWTPLQFPLGLVGYWPLGGLQGRHDNDVVGGYNMTPVNTPSWADHSPGLIYPSRPQLIFPAAAAAGETAGTAVVVAVLSQSAVAATHVLEVSATLAETALVIEQPTVTATYVLEVSAELAETTATVAQPEVTASHVLEVSANLAEVAAAVSQPAVTATHVLEVSASLGEVAASVSTPEVTAEGVTGAIAGTAAVVAIASQPAVTATWQLAVSAELSPLVASVSQPLLTAAWEAIVEAATAVVVAAVSQPAVTATSTIAVVRQRMRLVGTSATRVELQGTTTERMVLVGTSTERKTLVGLQ